jgi:hypothetical protein
MSGLHGIGQQVWGMDHPAITNLSTGTPFTVYANTAAEFSGFNSFLDRPTC